MVASGGCLTLMSCGTIMGVVITGAGKTSVLLVGELGLILGFLPLFSLSFVPFICSSLVAFVSFILVSVVLSLGGAFCWYMTSCSLIRAVG